MSDYNLYNGNCLDELKKLPDNSVDSIVTDPPYGLGDNLYKRINKAVWKSFNIMLPDFYEGDIKRIQYRDFSFKSSLCSDLSRCETIPIIKSRVAMPESPIYFDGNVEVREIEIDRSTVSSSFYIPDTALRDKIDANGSKFIGNFIFDFGNSIDFTADDVFGGNFGQFSYGFFSVPISSIFSSCFPNSGIDFPFPIFRDGIPDIVWGSDNMGDDSFTHSFALTESGTEDTPVLTFDLTRASDYSSATITTLKSNTFSNFIRPKIVRTNLTTSSLSTVLQPIKVSLVLGTTNGASSEYFLHLYVPKGLLNSISSIYTNASGFMSKKWDYDVPSVEIWKECLRVLKPGGHLLAFAGTRTQHRMAVRIEDAGFEIRDMIAWVYGSGFPKSLDVSKAIDKAGGASPAEQSAMLRSRREAAGMTREQVAELVGCTPSSVRDWEEGRARSTGAAIEFIVPSSEYRASLADVLGYSSDERRLIGAACDRREDGTVYGIGHSGNLRTGGNTEAARNWQGWGTALKPALETVTFASKPYTDEQERDIILSNLIRLEARLWLLSSASAAEKNSTSSQSEYGAACAIAQWSADEITSTRAALCDPMGMSLFELATTTSLNIVSSWRRTLAESWSDGSTSTTETKSSTTTDWRTLKFSLSQITPSTIIRACSLPGGFSVNASTAESYFNASLSLLQSIRTLSATERAMSQAQHEHQDAGVKPNLDPCIMARKPLVGTVANNVLKWGTGAINIDGCRVDGRERTEYGLKNSTRTQKNTYGNPTESADFDSSKGRFPANLILSHSDKYYLREDISHEDIIKLGKWLNENTEL